MNAESDEKPLGSRAPRFIKASPPLHRSWQVVIFLVGLAVVVGGVIMLPLPGPGWLIIFAGIGVWATEFPWAQRVLRWTKRKLREWARWVKVRRQERALRKEGRTPPEWSGAAEQVEPPEQAERERWERQRREERARS
ncbi:MAG: TIGR02611 family protein [Streptomyces sp.]|uniref:TIGR02611 family protein n=1 Tax=Streptomyces sp. TaxID=1931 RepID=UPI003D6AC95D